MRLALSLYMISPNSITRTAPPPLNVLTHSLSPYSILEHEISHLTRQPLNLWQARIHQGTPILIALRDPAYQAMDEEILKTKRF